MKNVPRPGAMARCALALTGLLAACSSVVSTEELGASADQLYLKGTKWPKDANGTYNFNYCFNSASMNRADIATVRANISHALGVGWGAAANLSFFDNGACPSSPKGVAVMNLKNAPADGSSSGNASSFGYPGASGTVTLDLTANAPQGLIIHEFGHLLGFRHEMARPDFTDVAGTQCTEPNVTGGDTLGTPANDKTSIMANWPYCGSFPNNWQTFDIQGVQVAYGKRPGVSGFAWAQNSTGDFDASPGFSFNIQGGTNHVTQTGTGTYRVDFEGLGANVGGNAQVTAYGTGSEYCNVSSWISNLMMLELNVSCFDKNGNPVNTRFAASYAYRTDKPGAEGGYVWADQPSSASYTPSTMYQWNSTGSNSTITRSGTGTYAVFLPGQDFVGGTTEVTAYGSNKHCKVTSWGPNSGGQTVNVKCFTPSGSAADTQFALSFSKGSPNASLAFAYAWSNDATSSSFTADTTYQKGFILGVSSANLPPAKPVTVSRSGTGSYNVVFPGMDSVSGKTNVKITSYGSDSARCKVASWGSNNASVRCFSSSGAAKDSRFDVTFSSSAFKLPFLL
jgi:hypothetical protein